MLVALAALPVASGAASSEQRFGGSRLLGKGGQIYGVRISNVVPDQNTLQVDFDVTEYLSLSYIYGTAYLGFFNTYPLAPAVDFGDGSFVPPLAFPYGIPFVSTGTFPTTNGGSQQYQKFRGSFSHTYGAPGIYDINANSFCCADYPTNAVVGAGDLTTYTLTYKGTYYSFPFFNDAVQVDLTGGGDEPSILEIPTMSTVGLMALGFALLGAGFVALRRVRV